MRFNGRLRTGWVIGLTDTPEVDESKVKPLDRVEGDVRWFGPDDLTVWRWVADRFAGTMSGAIAHALPPRIVRVEHEAASWGPARHSLDAPIGASVADGRGAARSGRSSAETIAPDLADGRSSPRSRPSEAAQPRPPEAAQPRPPEEGRARPPCASEGWKGLNGSALLKAAWEPDGRAYHLRPPLHQDIGLLLVDLVARTTSNGRTALVIVPGPAPGPADDVVAALGTAVADHRHLDRDADRYRAYLRQLRGDVTVAVGERGLALMPMPDLGLIVVVDEANPAYKERRNPRHHVREAALARGRMTGATVVLTSSLQSAQAHKHHDGGHLTLVRADRATERALAPDVRVVDRTTLSPKDRRTRLVGPITSRVAEVVRTGGTVIVLAAGKGSGSSLACSDCRNRHECRDCGAGIAPVDGAPTPTWRCAVCSWTTPPRPCIDCGGTETFPLRAGAKRLATELAKAHPDAEVGHMEGFDQPGPTSRPAIAVMTRGSVVARPDWLHGRRADLLVVADPDVLLGRPDVEAAEDALRLWLDGAALAEEVMVQTGQPTEPALQSLVRLDPDGFWPAETERRTPLGFPPAGSLIRMTGVTPEAAAAVRADVPGTLLGPDPDGVALLKTDTLRDTVAALKPLRNTWAQDDIRVRVDVDPTIT